jgi:hypothetical protein
MHSVSKQWNCKHGYILESVFDGVRAATVTMQLRGKHSYNNRGTAISLWPVPWGYLEGNWGDPGRTHVEAGSNTYTVTLRVVGGDEKRSLNSETVKYGRESQGTRTREKLPWQGPAACTNGRRILLSEKAPHKNKTVTVKR